MPFDPNAAALAAPAGRRRGKRWRYLLAGVAALATGAYAFDDWIASLFSSGTADAKPDIVVSNAEPFVPPPAPAPSPPPPAPPPKAEAPRAEPAKAAPRLPTRIAWNDVQAKEPDMPWFHDGRRPVLAKGCALRPGASIIRASLLTRIESEVAGQAIAQVSEDVYDADGVGRLLIPAGTRVVGLYKSESGLNFDRARLDFAWTEMTLPDGTQIDLGRADGADAGGAVGVGGHVTTPWGNVIATAALMSVFDFVATTPAVATDNQVLAAAGMAVGQNSAAVGREVTRRALSFEPRISIPAGTVVTILPRLTVQICG